MNYYQSLFDVKDKVVLITGGSRGIGEMIATGFVQGGSKVYISSRTTKACDEVAAKLTALGPGKCIALPADLQSVEEVNRLVVELSKHEDHLDILINNAGASWGAPLDKYPDAAFQKVLNLNLVRIFTLTQACLPLLKAKASKETPSRVINIGSVHGIVTPGVETYAYSSSKAALHHLTRHLSRNLGHEHVLVNAIAPGSFRSKMMQWSLENHGDEIVKGIPVGRLGSVEDIAGTCIYLSSRAGQYTVGAVIVVDGGAVPNSSKF
ncbi:hypothetical protein G6F55_010606 [Rhizopus delemar]|uniref:Uncharacterized protein n=2 Tax=Rhizopus TaxID=4842 RepID=A0A9P6YSX7_9FUNG|nr:hypothetical protein G6F43_000908 [Rhizopus delemar]KAG1535295.1 hypothetical protein G6F51_011616 [Rhizopus arrhizus]KAG1448525.1 hypothetical protein G6F55_010606 [Rhizopus delemar]KAG1507622.1 hypothetical protein G6F52_011589 [Rhizopus delemar]KAG1541542.1 hypothetical protein G6F49_011857 [Rhizopus delemar]